MIRKPIVTALNISTYTKILMPEQIGSIGVFTDDASSFLIAVDAAGTGAATIPANLSVGWHRVKPDDDGAVFYAKATVGTPNLVLLFSK